MGFTNADDRAPPIGWFRLRLEDERGPWDERQTSLHPRFSREQWRPAVAKSGTLYYPKWFSQVPRARLDTPARRQGFCCLATRRSGCWYCWQNPPSHHPIAHERRYCVHTLAGKPPFIVLQIRSTPHALSQSPWRTMNYAQWWAAWTAKGTEIFAEPARRGGFKSVIVGDGPSRSKIVETNPAAVINGWLPVEGGLERVMA